MDSLLAELLGMGFEMDHIERCREALDLNSSVSFNLQTATEWLLDKANQVLDSSSNPEGVAKLVLTPPTTSVAAEVQRISKPLSSAGDLEPSISSNPVTSRYNYGPNQREDKKRYQAKVREEMTKKAKEDRLETMKAQHRLRQQIQDDRRALEDKTSSNSSQDTPTSESASPTPSQVAPPPEASSNPPSSENCRVQVKLPGGGVVRKVFSSSESLQAVIQVVADNVHSDPSAIVLAQTYPRREFTSEEVHASLSSLRLTPSTSLIATIRKSMPAPGPTPKPHPLDVSEPMDTKEVEETLESRSTIESDDEEEEEEDQYMGQGGPGGPRNPLPPRFPAGMRGGLGMQLGRGRQRVYGRFMPPFGGDGRFAGEGHRLGGKEGALSATKKAAAVNRAAKPIFPQPLCSSLSHAYTPPSLASVCIRLMVSHSSHYGMPSCSHISPVLAQRLLVALKTDKRLNSKTLAAFHGCPLHVMNLDNYSLTTNELLSNISHFRQLTELSLVSCTTITDQAVAATLPFLHCLKSINFNGCSQLSEEIFRILRGCKMVETLQLSRMRISDQGLGLLLYYSLLSLRSLDLSHTGVTSSALEHLPKGAPILDTLNLEGTKVNSYQPLPRLPCLRSLSLSLCPVPQDVTSLHALGACQTLEVLSLAGVKMPSSWLQALSGLKLCSLKLPDRSVFDDSAMAVVSGFPLAALDLSDCLNVSDRGISHLSSMSTLSSLSLARTKLTDSGMCHLRGLVGLVQLSLDNTVVTDAGLRQVAGLKKLQELSLSDTRVTSKLILTGCLSELKSLSKLNLCRTMVADEGVLALSLPNLVALNLDWTCVTDAITKDVLLGTGCGVLETLRISNINQPLPRPEDDMETNMEEGRGDGDDDDYDYEEEMGEEEEP